MLSTICDLCIQVNASYCFTTVPRVGQNDKQRLLGLLRLVRTEAGLRQADLATKLGRPQSFVSRYESGERRVDLLELKAICRAVGIDLNRFVHRLEEGNR